MMVLLVALLALIVIGKRAALVLAAGVLMSSSMLAQQIDLDSLLAVWRNPAQPDSSRVKAYQDWIWEGYLFSRPDTAAVLAEALHAYAGQLKYPKASAVGHNVQGTAYGLQGDYARALEHLQRSLAIQEEIGSRSGVATGLVGIANILADQGMHPRALDHYLKALAISEEIGDDHLRSSVLGSIGIVYNDEGDTLLALDYFQKSLTMAESLRDQRAIALNNIFIAGIYRDQGKCARAIEHARKSLAIQETLGDDYGISSALNVLGSIHQKLGELDRAMEYAQRSLAIEKGIGNLNGVANSLRNIGDLHLQMGERALALDQCRQALALAGEIGAVDLQRDACECLYDAYKGMGRSDEALVYHEQWVALRDSMFNEENTKKLARLEMQYAFDKKDAEARAEQSRKEAIAAQELKRQKLVRNGISVGFAIALIFLGVVWRQRNRIHAEKRRSEALLLNILPEEVAEELKVKGSAQAVHIDQVTVLFTDFKGFTAMSEVLSPQDLVRDLNECFSAFDRITGKYGIEKIKTIGDAYMAAGGLPTPNNTHALDVIQAAFEMRDLIAEGRARKAAAGLPYFEIRIGIHTGPVVAGIVGVKKFQYDIWGDTVNTASRMESSGAPGQVNISEATYVLVKDEPHLAFTPRGKVQAKGKGEMDMYFVEPRLLQPKA